MSLYALDTDTLTLLENGHPRVLQQQVAHLQDDLAVTVISVEEQLSGWYRRIRQATKRDELARRYYELTRVIAFLAGWKILPFTEPAILRYEQLLAMKLNVGKMDLRSAAITLENGGILVTRNLRDFQRVPGITLENWAV
jgi:tRNA(fMet)-specific endonuclease VapC